MARIPPAARPRQARPPAPQKPAGMATYKRQLRAAIRKNAGEQEVNFLNITAMMDMMTIILVFLLKSMSASTSPPQSSDLMMPKSVVTTEAAQEGLAILVSKCHIVVDDNPVCPVPPDATHGVEGKYKRSGGTNDLYVVPLANAAQSWRDKDIMIRARRGKTRPPAKRSWSGTPTCRSACSRRSSSRWARRASPNST